ncbi:hypothetical protein [Corynebacterium sp. HMSC072A04]|uniref:hypothetical protein n=1 Tax=Corynebacterium sp. HMSC072A04 TaxID=1715045 RepID=UPI0008C3B452|nr:hypothetical protein [Corynebacterium sp. HMSC072A04]OFN38403.1 hypothetical protein HMPREF2565_03635 [Corynebacterium sp. HMSC072A04]
MFKNRVRTAALAGAIAVATGVSGVAVPAFAEDTTPGTTQGDGFNKPDASADNGSVADNVTEEQLFAMTNETANYIINNNQFVDAYTQAAAIQGDGINLFEQAQWKAYVQFANEATKQLAKAEANYQSAMNSVNYALEKDKAADKAWANYEEKAVDYNNTVTNIIGKEGDYKSDGLFATDLNALNDEGAKGGLPALKTPGALGFPIQKIDPEDANNVNTVPAENIKNLEKTIKEYKKAFDRAGDRDGDNKDQFITRHYIDKLETLISDSEMLLQSLKDDHAALEEAREAAQAASREAQKSDVLVRQGFLERAYAQVKVIRVLEANYAAGKRELELREAKDNQTVDIDGTTPKPTLREAYFKLFDHGGVLGEALEHNYNLLVDQEEDFKTLQDWTFKNVTSGDNESKYEGNRIYGPRILGNKVPNQIGNPEAPFANAPVALFNGDAHSDEERNAYTAAKVAANREVFGPSNYDITWEESFRKVVNADNAVQADIKQKADDVQARKDQADRTDALIKAVQDLANKSADNNGDNKGGDNGSDDATKPGNNKDDKSSNIKDKLSNDGKPTPLAIFGIVAGVLAAIAAAFPAIAKALNIKLPF